VPIDIAQGPYAGTTGLGPEPVEGHGGEPTLKHKPARPERSDLRIRLRPIQTQMINRALGIGHHPIELSMNRAIGSYRKLVFDPLRFSP